MAAGVITARPLRAVLVLLALSTAPVGVAATLAPQAFFDDFPLGAGWVAMLPPFNEHLVRDVGALNLGFTLLLAWAAARPRRALVVPACAALAVPALLHLAFHVTHLDGWPAADAIGQTLALAVQPVLLVAAVILARRAAPG